ncbi:MAG TPA: rod-binding protein [Gemmatimonadaceae bacterium]|nr:rod-binding protein [Gemmatimonadaceae bacterium]
MTAPIGPVHTLAAGATQANSDARLHKAAQQMEGIFISKMFAAMRETVPDDGIVQQNNAQSMFTDMFDQKIADDVPNQLSGAHSLAEALYQQLRQHEGSAQGTPKAGSTTP